MLFFIIQQRNSNQYNKAVHFKIMSDINLYEDAPYQAAIITENKEHLHFISEQ